MPFHLSAVQWLAAVLGAFLIGISKTGIPGIGILAVALFALAIPAQQSVGVVLVLLIVGDVVAVLAYRRHAVWRHLWRLFPWAAVGVIAGFIAMKHIHGTEAFNRLLGGILLFMAVLQIWRRRAPVDPDSEPSHPLWYTAGTGIAAGFTTMIANAAGPIMVLYLLSMRLPKMEFVGTGAWYFLCMNVFKTPFQWANQNISPASLRVDINLAPMVLIGALCGRVVLRYIDQAAFETFALILTALAALRLLL